MAGGVLTPSRDGGPGGAVTDEWNGLSWSAESLPQPAGVQDSEVGSVSCIQSTCAAVGSYLLRRLPYRSFVLVERFVHGRWMRLSAPSPGLSGPIRTALLFSVSCASARDCTAVGASDLGSSESPIVEHFDGRSWNVRRVVLPADITSAADYRGAGLGSVSCPSPTTCVAAGAYQTYARNAPTATTFVERWTGKSWSFTPLTSDDEVSSGPIGVSCTSATACTVVGTFGDRSPWLPQTNAPSRAFAERWNGTGWSAQAISGPRGARATALSAVSCTEAAACTAVGWSTGSTTSSEGPLVERWNGDSWRVEPSPAPRGVPDPFLVSVSCTRAGTCAAIGNDKNGGSFIERRVPR